MLSLAASRPTYPGDDMPGRATEIRVAGHPVIADMLAVLWLENSRTLVVSDMHLEKGSAFARRGMMLPPYDTGLTLDRLEAAMRRFAPRAVVSLGDSFHDPVGAALMPPVYAERLCAVMKGRDWFWIAGNHDPDRPGNLPGECVEVLCLDGLTFRHEPGRRGPATAGEIAGHLHPAARVVRRGRAVRRACFAGDGSRLVMPAFGVTTGGLDLRHRAMEGIFDRSELRAHLIGRERIFSVRFANLVG